MVNIELNEKRYEEIKSKKNSENPMIFANPSAPMNAQSSSSCSLEFSPCQKSFFSSSKSPLFVQTVFYL